MDPRSTRKRVKRAASWIASAIPLASIWLPTACSNDDSVDNTAPQACLSLEATPRECAMDYDLILRADCSADAEDSIERLRARWDFEGDGVWDSDWLPASDAVQHRHTRLPNSDFFVSRVEVEDSGGLRGKTFLIHHYAIELAAPDLVAWSVQAFAENAPLITPIEQVVAGEPFDLLVSYTCYRANLLDWGSSTMSFFFNGELVRMSGLYCLGPVFHPCAGSGVSNMVITEPGTWEIRAVLGSPTEIAETNLDNNTVSMQLEVLPADR